MSVFRADRRVVPAVMFHSIGLEESDWVFRNISEPVCHFEEKIACLKRAGFHFVFWAQLHDYMAGREKLELPAVLLTFDDGYLDNWVYAYPILKKYGAKGTIFVNPEFVEQASGVRPNLEDVWSGRVTGAELIVPGFLSWDEMRRMESSGLIDIQSHSLTHTWCFSGPKVVAFHSPGEKRFPWVGWNAWPETKPYYLRAANDLTALGSPIYEHKKALVCRRFFPPEGVGEGVIDFVRRNGDREFFSRSDWEVVLREVHRDLAAASPDQGRYETDDERRGRLRKELAASKTLIERELGKSVDFVCWPGGGYDPEVAQLARECGYKAWTLSSADRGGHRNVPGADPSFIKRIGSAPRQYLQGRLLGYTTGPEFVAGVRRHQGSLLGSTIGWGWKLRRISRGIRLGLKWRPVRNAERPATEGDQR